MGSGIELATAYVQVLPSAEGIKGSLSKVLEPEADSAGEKTGKSLGNSIGSFIKTAFVALGVGEFIKDTIMKGADLEQSIGGIETLFGTGGRSLEEYAKSVGKSVEDAKEQYQKLEASEQYMLEKAQVAWKTTGMSANDYMQNVTGFSASLLQGLGGDTAKAAEYADRAMVDMSDNANKMGTSMESITNAYQGFAKQNYTMLDNLKLGYGGTKEEMARLIEDASKMTDIQEKLGVTVDASSMSFDNIINAISVMQSSLDIAGTTKEEAASTISGSMNAMKAAWENLQADMTMGNDLQDDISALSESVLTAANNLLPAISNLLSAIPPVLIQLIQEIAPPLIQVTLETIASLANTLAQSLPTLIDAGLSALFSIVDALIANIGVIISAGLQLVLGLATGLLQAIPQLISQVPVIIESVLTTLLSLIPQVIEAGLLVFSSLAENLPGIISNLTSIIPRLIDSIISTIIQLLPLIVETGVKLLSSLVSNLPLIIKSIVSAVPLIINSLNQAFGDLMPVLVQVGWDLFNSLLKMLPQVLLSVFESGYEIVDGLISVFTECYPKLFEIGKNMLDGIWQGIKNGWNGLVEAVKELAGELLSGIKETLGIHSPSRVFRDEVGKMLDLGLAEGITGNIDEVNKAVAALNDSTMAGIESDIAVNASYAGNMAVSSGYVDDRAVYNMLAKLVDAVGKLPGDIGEEIAGEMNGTSISLNNREFGRLVRAVS